MTPVSGIIWIGRIAGELPRLKLKLDQPTAIGRDPQHTGRVFVDGPDDISKFHRLIGHILKIIGVIVGELLRGSIELVQPAAKGADPKDT